jgi:hypothetical protein
MIGTRSIYSFLFAAFCPLALAGDLPPPLQDLGLRESETAARDLAGWKQPGKVVVRTLFGEDVSALREFAPGADIVAVRTVEEAIAAIPGAQVLIGFCNQAIFDAADSLHWVQVYFAGVENCVVQPAMQGGPRPASWLATSHRNSAAPGKPAGTSRLRRWARSRVAPCWWWVSAASVPRWRSALTGSGCA